MTRSTCITFCEWTKSFTVSTNRNGFLLIKMMHQRKRSGGKYQRVAMWLRWSATPYFGGPRRGMNEFVNGSSSGSYSEILFLFTFEKHLKDKFLSIISSFFFSCKILLAPLVILNHCGERMKVRLNESLFVHLTHIFSNFLDSTTYRIPHGVFYHRLRVLMAQINVSNKEIHYCARKFKLTTFGS